MLETGAENNHPQPANCQLDDTSDSQSNKRTVTFANVAVEIGGEH